ncbi:ubiquitin carboxyl-terminal hydrolase MINDY-3-like [Anneissia japonica]|uniref:ubiquitin carboxyl-terminal hydrolase MINDY-3-like n=1 Tax=Anneissia japonica TaxID=1529436 RepID=UPI0014258AC4|nr:ubiquitin carboxyl-terminal hydrolase MINDY-3-like [Anneissia japonica]
MASTSSQDASEVPNDELEELKMLVWGNALTDEVFKRWCQGFVFSPYEPSALLQHEGGPCAVLAPLQAYVLKNLLSTGDIWRDLDDNQAKDVLLTAIEEVFLCVSNPPFKLVLESDKQPVIADMVENEEVDQSDHARFHKTLRVLTLETAAELHQALHSAYDIYVGQYGVVLFLYSLLMTKGIANVKNEMEDANEPLVDGIYGHGSQSLVNLMLTGNAVSHVFDNEKEVDGLKMRGITAQPSSGFLTMLEHFRYCEVGWYLKNPTHPIWVLGSETHLTVFFTKEMSLVAPESKWERARRVFCQYDTQDSGFIQKILLQDVLQVLQLVTIPEYVDIIKQKLDPDDYGIILLSSFMNEFFPDEPDRLIPVNFPVYHYNGLIRSCPESKVKYIEGVAEVPDPQDIQGLTDASPVESCLRTKWPTFMVNWENNLQPSTN